MGITYIAMNETIAPLNKNAVRRAMNRQQLLTVVYGGRGFVKDGIFPHGLYGHNPDLPAIPYDPEAARKLLEEAGYPNGF
ncbi:ABC transporter substrate-binding protein [[Clostridium] aminophilum]|uniref:ABC transporter substrate-binding protein n=1 Tax=[Clostridium] aminophilum TaxID=1526 RepID=UPI003F9B614B